jgi:hypothetical protein
MKGCATNQTFLRIWASIIGQLHSHLADSECEKGSACSILRYIAPPSISDEKT